MENTQLTIADLASLHNMLDTACTRGAFKASEMTQVGQVYDKLSAFLKSIQDTAKAQAESAQPEVSPSQPAGEQNA